MAFPGLLLLLTVMSIVGRGMVQIIVVLGITGGIPAPRIVRGAAIIAEASLSFLGFGLPLEIPSWGSLLSRDGRKYMSRRPGWRCGPVCA